MDPMDDLQTKAELALEAIASAINELRCLPAAAYRDVITDYAGRLADLAVDASKFRRAA